MNLVVALIKPRISAFQFAKSLTSLETSMVRFTCETSNSLISRT